MRTSPRLAVLFTVSALGLASAACDHQWRASNKLQEQFLGWAEGEPVERNWSIQFLAGWERDCAVGKFDTCFQAGSLLLFGPPDVADPARAKPILLDMCIAAFTKQRVEHGMHACTFLGIGLLTGVGNLDADPRVGLQLLQEQCRARDRRACAYSAFALEKGLGTEKDLPAALAQYDELCSARRYFRVTLDLLAAGDTLEGLGPPSAFFGTSLPPRSVVDRSGLPVGRATREPFACLRVATLVETGVIDDRIDVAAQLYADVCLDAQLLEERANADVCAHAATLFLDHGYTTHPELVGVPLGPLAPAIEGNIVRVGANAWDLSAQGCFFGSKAACKMLRAIYDLEESRGEIFDLR